LAEKIKVCEAEWLLEAQPLEEKDVVTGEGELEPEQKERED